MWVEGDSLILQCHLHIACFFSAIQDVLWNRIVVDSCGRLVVNVAILFCCLRLHPHAGSNSSLDSIVFSCMIPCRLDIDVVPPCGRK